MYKKGIQMKILPVIKQFKTSVYHFKQDILHSINPERCKYILLAKTNKSDISLFTDNSVKIPESADSFTFVDIGKRKDKNYRKKIFTFYEGDNIVARLIDATGANRILREYSDRGNLSHGHCKYRTLIHKEYNEGSFDFLTKFIEEQKAYKYKNSNKIVLQIHKNVYDGRIIHASITEYPSSGHKALRPKSLGLDIELFYCEPVIRETYETTNVSFPVDDVYLPYRFILDKCIKLKTLTRFFIKEKCLDKLGIKVEVSDNIAKNSAGYFSESSGKIVYRENTACDLVGLVAHEVEHAYQYKQIGRLGKGCSDYEKNSRKYYGHIDGFNESMEANKYVVASENYPLLKDDEDLSKNMEYQNNYLEVKAREASEKAINDYTEKGRKLSSQFFFGI